MEDLPEQSSKNNVHSHSTGEMSLSSNDGQVCSAEGTTKGDAIFESSTGNVLDDQCGIGSPTTSQLVGSNDMGADNRTCATKRVAESIEECVHGAKRRVRLSDEDIEHALQVIHGTDIQTGNTSSTVESESDGPRGILGVGTKLWKNFKRAVSDAGTKFKAKELVQTEFGSTFGQFETAYKNPRWTDGVLRQVDGKIFERLSNRIDGIWDSHVANQDGVRRILHDTIPYCGSAGSHREYNDFLERIAHHLQGLPWYAISFHSVADSLQPPTLQSNYARLQGINYWECYGNTKLTATTIQPNRPIIWQGNTYWQYLGFGSLCEQVGGFWQEIDQSNTDSFPPIFHKGHFHVLHPCDWTNRECKHLNRTFNISERKGNSILATDIDETRFKNILVYMSTEPRFASHTKMSTGPAIHYVPRTEYIPKGYIHYDGTDLEVATCRDENQSGHVGHGSGTELSHTKDSGNSRRKDSKASTSGEDRTKAIIEFFLNHATFPLENILRTTAWENSPFNTMIASDKQIQRVISIIQNRMANWTYAQYLKYYENVQVKLWGCHDIDEFKDYYYTEEESMEIIDRLLDYQLESIQEFHDLPKEERKSHFLNEIFDILEKQKPKVNTFMVVSEPSAGKNFFFDPICAWYINVGLIQNFNRYNNFPLMEAINRRVNIWNEPNIEPAAFDTVKMLLAGDPLKAAVKYQTEQPLNKTPIIIMSNKNCFPNNSAFNDRMLKYKWKRAPFLRKYIKKINPGVWPLLVNKYVLV